MGQVKYPYSTRDIRQGLSNNLHKNGSWSLQMIKLILPITLILHHEKGWDEPSPGPQSRAT